MMEVVLLRLQLHVTIIGVIKPERSGGGGAEHNRKMRTGEAKAVAGRARKKRTERLSRRGR